ILTRESCVVLKQEVPRRTHRAPLRLLASRMKRSILLIHRRGLPMNTRLIAALAVGATCLGGCASITEGTHPALTVNTNPPGASCVLNRTEGQIASIASTPDTVTIRKTKHDITIVCNKPGYQTATFMNHSGVEAMTFGNIVLGGGVGWA